ncbi:phosphodiester glycosidase family protein [Streptacidiphilus albus]|uniref:phosphodiester glycosidase family protein n=1 Tax=Streptacidiphilus albus TaxID=105425 RepID=UPI00054BC9BD|nr:phosphodiester glycosidase family protein [Streptacidiphilus albus]
MASKQHGRARSIATATAAFTVLASLGLYGSAPALAAGSTRPGAAAVRTGVADTALGQEHWSTTTAAPGVQVSTVTLSNAASPFWTVTLEQPVTSKVTGSAADAEVESGSWVTATASRLASYGYELRVEPVAWPAYSDTPHGLMGYRLRVGEFPTQAAAATAAAAIAADGFTTTTEWTGYDASTPATLENIHVAVIDPKVFTGTVEGTHDGALAQRQTPSAVADQLGSLVATNGGFFVIGSGDGIPGTQSGLGVYNGKLESLASGARAALVIQDNGRKFQVADLTSSVVAQVGGSRYAVHGVNRVPGTVRDCGTAGATPTTHPEQDVDCYETDDLVEFTGELGAALPTGAGTQVVLDHSGRVLSVGARGGSVPTGDTVLQGIGTASTWLGRQALVGRTVKVDASVRNAATGASIPLTAGTSIVSAAPLLVQNGRTDIDAAAEGVVDPQDLSFNYQWADARQPRTIAGVDKHGDLILVTVDGRLTAGSEGFTLAEEATFMRSLGAVQALNLDGGGSTAMAVGGNLVTNPSDATGERPVGDTIQVLP